MRIAVAPNAFRGSLSAFQAAACISEGLQRSRLACDVTLLPLADGGDGTLAIMIRALGGEQIPIQVTGPDGIPIIAQLGLLADGQTAIVETAQASGVERIASAVRDPLHATSYGTGELISAALSRGYPRIIVGLGGSATNDGGAGCMQALGAELFDAHNMPIPRGGAALAQLDRIDVQALKRILEPLEVVALCDVDNPLIGERGASRVFAPQKGADAQAVETLETAMIHYADIIRRDLGMDVTYLPGAGAAGGLGAGLAAFLNATLTPGADMLISLMGYDQQLEEIDLVITGEGKLDAQTASGKAVQSIAGLALKREIPVIALVGTLDSAPEALRTMGIDAAWSIVPGPCDLQTASTHAAKWLTRAAVELGNTLAIARR